MQKLNIVIAGLFASGKQEFFISLIEINVVPREPARITTDKENQTAVAVEFGRITVNRELTLSLFIIPNQPRFDIAWKMLVEERVAVVLMLDSATPQHFREVRSIIKTLQSYAPMPFIVVANKQDLAEAWSVDDMRIALQLDDHIRLVPCVARNPLAVQNILLELIGDAPEETEI